MKGFKKGTSHLLFVLASKKLYESEDQCSNPLSYGRTVTTFEGKACFSN